ncbi:MAG TPA: peptidylprolyl isomerase [Gammaproteobacteria bacterium]|nr:peptidylprolyl isomerase [Gammaproteobacteria bacterium]
MVTGGGQTLNQQGGVHDMTLLDFLRLERGSKSRTRKAAAPPRPDALPQVHALTTVRGKPITVDDVLLYLKATGVFRNAIYQIISIEVITLKARELKLSVTEEELHAYSKARRESLGLVEATAMNDYCKWLGITFDHWQKQIEIELLHLRLKKALFPEARIREQYEAHRQELKTLSVSRIVTRDHASLREMAALLQAGQRDFSTLAREHSLEQNTRVAGGYLGRIRWGMLPADVEKVLFAAAPAALVGPLSQDGYSVLYRVDDVQEADYTEKLKEQISERLFAEWLEREVRIAPA